MAETIMDVEILADGKVSVTTGDVGETVHLDADELLEELSDLLGGEVTRTKREHPFWRNRTVLRGGKVVRTA